MTGLLRSITFLLLFLCSASSNAIEPSRFRFRLNSDPTGFDWAIHTTTVDTYIFMNIMEGLVGYDDKLNVVPNLAQKWRVSKDGLTYTFNLKKNIKWSDGAPLKAQHFVDGWLRVLNPETGSAYASFLYDIVGAEDYAEGKNKAAGSVGISAPDEHTFVIHLKRPVTHFIHMPTFWVMFPQRLDLIKKHPKDWNKPGKLVTLGPYVLNEYKPQQHVILKRNPLYYGAKAKIEYIDLNIINENSTAVNLYRSGQLDAVNKIDLVEIGDLTKSPDFKKAPYLRVHFLSFNSLLEPFNDPNVRLAFCHGIDAKKIPQLFLGAKRQATALVPPELFNFGVQPEKISYLGVGARKYLTKAGILNPGELNIELLAENIDEYILLTQFLQQEIKKNLGINLSIKLLEQKTLRSRVSLGQGHVHLLHWGADYPDPDTFLGVFLSNSGNNKARWKNTTYDSLVLQARSLKPGKARDKMLADAASMITGPECPILPLYFDEQLYLLNPKVHGFKINALNYVYFKDISL